MSLWNWLQRRRAGSDRARLRALMSGQERTPQAIKLRRPEQPPSLPDVNLRPLAVERQPGKELGRGE